MITAAMSTHLDFENLAVGGAGDFLVRLTAVGTAWVGQRAVFVLGGQVIVTTATMAFAAALLTARTRRPRNPIRYGLSRRFGLGLTPKTLPFQFADLTFEKVDLSRLLGRALLGPLMLSSPIVGLATQIDDGLL
jgi:hypothetical protein